MNELRLAFSFLTRLPVSLGDETLPPSALADAMWAFPLVGVVVGSIGGLIFLLGGHLGLPAPICSILTVASMIAATGALHEDGLADMADGTGGSTRERKLDIMRDSRIGTYGVVALLIVLALKVCALPLYASATSAVSVAFLLASAAATSRVAMIAAAYALPGARADGLSALAGRPSVRTLGLAIALALGIDLLILPVDVALTGIAASVVGAAGVMALARQQLGGQTGDVLGACQQIAEIAFLLAALAASG